MSVPHGATTVHRSVEMSKDLTNVNVIKVLKTAEVVLKMVDSVKLQVKGDNSRVFLTNVN
jgi:hypothetical protein